MGLCFFFPFFLGGGSNSSEMFESCKLLKLFRAEICVSGFMLCSLLSENLEAKWAGLIGMDPVRMCENVNVQPDFSTRYRD